MQQEKNKKLKAKKIVFLMIIMAAFLAALISMEYGETVNNGKYGSNIKSIKDFFYDAGNKSDFAVWNSHIYYCTKDGVSYIDSDGEILWSETYNMSLPYMVQNESIIGICEQKGRTLIIYDSKGKMYSVQTDGPIVSFCVNPKGFSNVIISLDNEYAIQVHNSKGDVIFSGHFQMSHGIPISSAISNDGNILAVSFLNINEMTMLSQVSFYDINDNSVAGSETDVSVFASFDESGAACGIINFIDDETAACVSDKALTFVYVNPDASEKYRQKCKIDFKNQIRYVAFDENACVYASFGEKLVNYRSEAFEEGSTVCYDKDGIQKFVIASDKKITGVYPCGESVLIGMDRNFENFSLSGESLWEYNTGADTKKLLIIDDNLVLFVGTNKASIFKLTDEILREQQLYNSKNEEDEEENEENEENEEDEEETIISVDETEEMTVVTTETPAVQNKNTDVGQNKNTVNKKETDNSGNNVSKEEKTEDTKVFESKSEDSPVEIDPSDVAADNNSDKENQISAPESNTVSSSDAAPSADLNTSAPAEIPEISAPDTGGGSNAADNNSDVSGASDASAADAAPAPDTGDS